MVLVTSAVAVLTVSAWVVPVAITTPLLSQTNFIGASATFNVVATGGAPLSYFWFFNGAPITFDLTNSLVVSNLTLASNGTYSVIVSNAAGAALPSAAVLTVRPQIPSLVGPVAASVQLGGTTAFSVTLAAGTPPVTYQWRTNGVNLADGSGYTGSVSNLLIITNAQYAQAASYSVVVGNAAGSITSAVVTLTVTSPLSYVAYTYAGQVYAQSFNSLPNPGLVSVNTANPATIATIAYSPASPFDFATSAPGGFGLSRDHVRLVWIGRNRRRHRHPRGCHRRRSDHRRRAQLRADQQFDCRNQPVVGPPRHQHHRRHRLRRPHP